MKTVSTAQKPLHLSSIVLVGALSIALAAPAAADKQHPAPIVYATGTSPYPAGTPEYIAPSRSPDAKAKKEARIQFRYPGQANSAPEGQGSVAEAPASREYASISTPAPSARQADPVSSPSSFDARAAAAQAEAQRSIVESEALPSLTPAPEPELTVIEPVAQQQYQPSMPQAAPAVLKQTPAASYTVSGEPVPVFDETVTAIVYGPEFDGLPTANGEMFDANAMTAAHPTLPLPSLIQVVNPATGREVVLRVNDRGPFEDGASLQVSQRAATELGMDGAGKANLQIHYLGAAPAMTVPAQPAPAPQMVAQDTYTPATQPQQQTYLVPASYDNATTSAQQQTRYEYSAPSVTAASTGDYFVQIGSFADISNAQSMSNRVPSSLPVTIVPARVNGADYFRVRVGPLANRADAESARDDLAYSGISQGRIVSGE